MEREVKESDNIERPRERIIEAIADHTPMVALSQIFVFKAWEELRQAVIAVLGVPGTWLCKPPPFFLPSRCCWPGPSFLIKVLGHGMYV